VTPPDRHIFPEARETLEQLVAGLDATAPGLVRGILLTGSIALGDGRSGQSDIDLVLVRDDAADQAATLTALESVLAGLRRDHPRPLLDGIVLSAADLKVGPDAIADDRVTIFDSIAALDPGGSLRNPVTWHTLRQCGIAYRGDPLDPNRLWHDPAGLDAWTRGNLESYWRPWLGQAERLTKRHDIAALIEEATEWGVLGVTRLHATLATGTILSKLGAGRYAMERFPVQWHPIVEEALRIRERREEPSRFTDPIACAGAIRAYMAMVIEDALAMPPSDGGERQTP
jgi:hypothetical protein